MTSRSLAALALLLATALPARADPPEPKAPWLPHLPDPEPLRSLSARWELGSEDRKPTFRLRSYRDIYVLPATWSSDPNDHPRSPTRDGSTQQRAKLDRVEVKFQLSGKLKIAEGLLGRTGDLWIAYSQTSHWQAYNSAASRPFRETSYEPELIFTSGVDLPAGPLRLRLLGLELDHESNGQGGQLSRSWNRVIGMAGLERPELSLVVRGWWRIPEKTADDDNPDIADYAGRAELVLTYVLRQHVLSLRARHSLRTGEHSHGALEIDWSFPFAGAMRGYVHATTGYAESLIDYNHRATTVGVGVSLLDWE